MPVVRVKGVANPMQFPDDMDIEDIKAFLQRKFAQQAVTSNKPADLAPLQGQARKTEQSLAEKAGQGISNALYDSGVISDRYGAQRIGENVTSIGEFLPVIGDATAGDEFGRALKQGDGVGMALGALGAIPLVGDAAKRLLRKPKYITLPSGRMGADKFRMIKSMDPSAVSKANPDGSVGVSYLDEYQPTQIKGPLHEFDPDALELSEGEFKNTTTYKGDKDKPITVTKENGNYIILDGHHRAKLAKEDGRNVKAIVIPLDDVKDMQKENIHQAEMFSEWVATGKHKTPSTNKAMSVGDGITLNDLKDMPYKEQQKIAKGLKTGQPVEFYYSRNLEKAPKMTNMDFGQSIEPAGRYMNVDFSEMSGGNNWETGTIRFNNPLVVEHKNTNSTGWKKDLSDKYGGSVGKRLSNKIKKDGYDAIITVDDYGLSETISLK